MIARLIAVVIHEIREELRKLDPPAADGPSGHRPDPASTTAADTERAQAWDHDSRPPVTASFGFGKAP